MRTSCLGAATMEQAAGEVVHRLFVDFSGPGDAAECVLVRFYLTVPYAELDAGRQDFARGVLGDTAPWPELPCLTLLASAGVEPAWNDAALSQHHRAIPLPSPETVAKSPMIAQLLSQLGLELSSLLSPDPEVIIDLDQRQYNVFHVAEAVGSPYVPAQADFVVPYGVRSAVGFGGMLPSGEMFALVLFSRVPISRATADLLRTIALNVKVAILPLVGRTFVAPPA
ncbi:MAG TPA: hypothetical protein VNB94_01565 [Mycobacteriales bacterium]|nr:hypothetical protein [Mycobacteriales bacterium]